MEPSFGSFPLLLVSFLSFFPSTPTNRSRDITKNTDRPRWSAFAQQGRDPYHNDIVKIASKLPVPKGKEKKKKEKPHGKSTEHDCQQCALMVSIGWTAEEP